MSSITKCFNDKANPVISYLCEHSLRLTDTQKWLIEETKKLKDFLMLSSGDEMQLLANICKSIRAKKTLDIGVFTGYSSLTIAASLPEDGKVYAFDISDEFMKDLCEPAWTRGGVRHKIIFKQAPALDSLRDLVGQGDSGTFDFAFIDADKVNYENYFEECLKLVRPGGIIAVDNVLWSNRVLNADDSTPNTIAIKAFNKKLKDDTRIDISMINIGDGVTLAFKK